MIFATVGTQLPFDRLIRAVDHWAGQHPRAEVYAQIGTGEYVPKNMAWTREMDPERFRAEVTSRDIVVAHAGMGTIISAVELGKRVIVMPRLSALGEHRNDHQLATVARLSHLRGFDVVQDSSALAAALAKGGLGDSAAGGLSAADPRLIHAIRRFAGLEAA